MYNIIHQKSKPSVDLTIRHWPHILVGGVGLMNLYKNREWLKPLFKEVSTLIHRLHIAVLSHLSLYMIATVFQSLTSSSLLVGLCTLSPFESIPIAGIALLALVVPCLLLGDSISGAMLLLHHSDKKNQSGHAQRLLSYWKIHSIFMLPEFAPLIHRLYPNFFNYLRNMSNHFFSELVDELVSEKPGYIGNLATMVITNCMFYWGLRTLIKDLKGEPRSWWGGKLEIHDLENEKDMSSKK